MSFEKFLQGLMGEEKGEPVGVVDKAYIERLKEVEDKHEAQHQEMAEKVHAYMKPIMEEMKAKAEAYTAELMEAHMPECEEHRKQSEKVWEDIKDELLVMGEEREMEYSINAETGMVTRKPVGEEDFGDMMTQKLAELMADR